MFVIYFIFLENWLVSWLIFNAILIKSVCIKWQVGEVRSILIFDILLNLRWIFLYNYSNKNTLLTILTDFNINSN